MTRTTYRKDKLLGTGGMAEVWLSSSEAGQFAVKRLLPHAARNPSLAAAFEREGRLLGRLHHPNIVGLYEMGRDGEGPFLVLEYVDGWTLRTLCESPLPTSVVLRIARDILFALEAVHDLRDKDGDPLGIVHRDLSPANVLVSVTGQVKLTDFGIARGMWGSHATTGLSIKGTLSYLSPEQAQGKPVDARSDLFAVGALCFEMLAGRAIYQDADPRLVLARSRAGEVDSLVSVRPDLPRSLVEWVDRALAAHPADRFANARLMREELVQLADRFADDEELGAHARVARPSSVASSLPMASAREPSTSAPRKRRSLRTLGAAVLALTAGALSLLAVARSPDRHPAPGATAVDAGSATLASPPEEAPRPAPHPPEPATTDPAEKKPRLPLAAHAAARSDATTSPTHDGPPATVSIGSEPGYAYVKIDGVRVGATPIVSRALPPGRHRIDVTREGVGTKTLQLDIRSGEHVTRVVKFP